MSIVNRLDNMREKKDFSTVAIISTREGTSQTFVVVTENHIEDEFNFVDISRKENICYSSEESDIERAWEELEERFTVFRWTTTDKILELLNDD